MCGRLIGPCYLEPIMDIAMPGGPRVSYTNVTAQKVKKILKGCLLEDDLLPQMAAGHFGDESFSAKTGIPRFLDLPMLKPQVRVILKNCGYITREDRPLSATMDTWVFSKSWKKDRSMRSMR
jgi:hypothetical protein